MTTKGGNRLYSPPRLALRLLCALLLTLAERLGWETDWSQHGRNRVQPATAELLARLEGPLEIGVTYHNTALYEFLWLIPIIVILFVLESTPARQASFVGPVTVDGEERDTTPSLRRLRENMVVAESHYCVKPMSMEPSTHAIAVAGPN